MNSRVHNYIRKLRSVCLAEARRDQKRAVELGSRSEFDYPFLLRVSTAGHSHSVKVTQFRAAVERASSGGHKLLRTGGVPTSFTLLL